ncbi:MoaD/ThiS family protein [Micrococcales bacterium 31B]|nr:MoaD/ThiS family protein [Micrococcales bacterium 31B]
MATHLTQTCDVHLFAGAAAAADTRQVTLQVPEKATLLTTVALLRTVINKPDFDAVLDRSTFLVDGVAVTTPDAPLRPACRLDVMPPFAGG